MVKFLLLTAIITFCVLGMLMFSRLGKTINKFAKIVIAVVVFSAVSRLVQTTDRIEQLYPLLIAFAGLAAVWGLFWFLGSISLRNKRRRQDDVVDGKASAEPRKG